MISLLHIINLRFLNIHCHLMWTVNYNKHVSIILQNKRNEDNVKIKEMGTPNN
jgi:hypothetical protein